MYVSHHHAQEPAILVSIQRVSAVLQHVPVITDRVSREGKAIGSVRLSVCSSVLPSVRLLRLYLLNRDGLLNWSLCVGGGVMTVPRLESKVKVVGQGQMSVRVGVITR